MSGVSPGAPWLLLATVSAVAAGCSSPGGAAVDAPLPPGDAADPDAAVDAPTDAAVDAPDPCADLGFGPAATYDETVPGPKQGEQREVLIGWPEPFSLMTWQDVDGVVVQRVSNTGSYIDTPHRIGPGAPAAIACLPTGQCMVALRDPPALVRVMLNGTPIDATPISDPGYRELPALGAANGQFLVVFHDASNDWRVQRYGVAGGAMDPVPRTLPPLSGANPVVAGCDANGCLVAYPGATPESGRFRVPWVGAVGALAAAPGAWDGVACNAGGCLWAADGAGFVTDVVGDAAAAVPLPSGKVMSLAANGASFELVSRSQTIADDWRAFRISGTGEVSAQGALPSTGWTASSVACSTSLCLVAGEQLAADATEHDVGVVRVDQTVLEDHMHYVVGANGQSSPLVASSGTGQLVVWLDRRLGEGRWRFARRAADGAWLDAAAIELPAPPAVRAPDLGLTWTGHAYLLAWVDAGPPRALRAVRISPQGTILDGTPLTLVAGAQRQAIACTQDVCLAVTTAPGAGGAQHVAQRLDAAALTPLGAAIPLDSGVDLSPVWAAAGQGRFAVLAKVGAAHALTRLGVDGTVLDAPALAVADPQTHALVGLDGGFALASSAAAGGPGSLRFVAATVGPRVALAAEATAPVLASLGADVVVSWKYPDSLAARRYAPGGDVGAARPIGGETAAQAAMTGGPAGEVLAAWSEYDAAATMVAPRLRVRRLCGP
ncbi:MAG TPA: hypothetical protein VHE35_22000 [Kofleriaceae bacterium]|nr:hypothetical protein [Kofleriaceae bacterium]